MNSDESSSNNDNDANSNNIDSFELNFSRKIHGWHPRLPSNDSENNCRLLRLKIHSGHNLAKKDIFGASDPYVRIDLLRKSDRTVIDSLYTKTKKKTLNPVWNEEFIIRVLPTSHIILLEVFDENRLTRDAFLGKIEISLNNNDICTETPATAVEPKQYTLQQRSQKSKVRGHLEIYLSYIGSPSSIVNDNSDDQINNEWEIINDDQRNDQSSNQELPDLPAGWEERQDSNGRTYYVNHNRRSTQWERPTFAADASDDRTNSDEFNTSDLSPSTSSNSRDHTAHSTDNRSSSPSSRSLINHRQAFDRRFHIGSSKDQSTTVNDTDSTNSQGSLNSNDRDERHHQSERMNLSSSSSADNQNNHPPVNVAQQDSPTRANRDNSSSSSSLNDNSRTTINSGDNNPSNAEEPLPPGWTQQLSETGRIFFIDHNRKTTTWIDPRTGQPSPPAPSSSHQISANHSSHNHSNNQHQQRNNQNIIDSKHALIDHLGPLPPGWEERVHRDGRIFFINHNTKSTQWEDPRIDMPSLSGTPIKYSRDYKKKYEQLHSSLTKPNGPNKFEIKVRRDSILEDSFRYISNVSKVDYLKAKLWIEFEGEDALDYGGISREWFYLLSREMFNPYYGLFEYSSSDKYTLQIKPFSGLCNELHIAYFKFIGRVAGMAIYHGKLLDAFFIRPFYKMMLEKEITLEDMESVDIEYYKSLKYILENDPSDLCLNFSIDEKFFDVYEEKELKPGGAQIPVTNENKHEYISLVINWRFVSRVKPQMDAFLEGFHEIIPKHLIKMFDENELELLMCGIGNIDVKDWRQNTVYKGGYHLNHIVIQWFWRVVLSFNNEMRSRLLQFVTGTSRVPMNGFKELYGSNGPQLFTIEKWGNVENLPRSHTCFNRLDLPCYKSYIDLRNKLEKAIQCSETFGGVD